ncbi:MAG TPA: hypothetical protein DCQ31_04700 [Bacteroidales bacterium]|nr:hypothetical protein [Bacteroidales bacterium]
MNSSMGFSKSMHWVLGYNWLINKDMRIKIEAYYQNLYHIPVKESEPTFSMLNFGDSYFNQLPIIDSLQNVGTGKNYGAELTFERFFNNGYYWLLTSSIYQSKYKGYDNIERNTAFNGNFIVNVLAGKEFQIKKRHLLSFNGKIAYAGSLRTIPFDVVEQAPGYFVRVYDFSRSYENRRNNYFRLTGRFAYKLNLQKWSAELAIDFMNMTNHKDIFMEYFDSKTGETRYSYQFSFLPIGFLRFQF